MLAILFHESVCISYFDFASEQKNKYGLKCYHLIVQSFLLQADL